MREWKSRIFFNSYIWLPYIWLPYLCNWEFSGAETGRIGITGCGAVCDLGPPLDPFGGSFLVHPFYDDKPPKYCRWRTQREIVPCFTRLPCVQSALVGRQGHAVNAGRLPARGHSNYLLGYTTGSHALGAFMSTYLSHRMHAIRSRHDTHPIPNLSKPYT